METENPEKHQKKDGNLENLERMLEKMPEASRKPIQDLIKKRKVELGLEKSNLKPIGYILKKGRSKPQSKPKTKESAESLRKIAQSIGKITETKETDFHDIDLKEEPLKKERKALEEIDSYKY